MGLSLRAYARSRGDRGLRGGHLRAVQRAIAAGWIVPLADGSIDPDQADAGWAAGARPDMRVDPGGGETRRAARGGDAAGDARGDAQPTRHPRRCPPADEDFAAARTRKERALADAAERANRVADGELIEVAPLERALFDIGATARARLETLGQRLAPTVVALTDLHACREAIDAEARAIGNDIADAVARLGEEAPGDAGGDGAGSQAAA